MPPKKVKTAPASSPDNALAKQALDTIKQIDREAMDKKMAQLEMLKSAKATLMDRIDELNHQLAQIDKTMEAITGHPAPSREKRERRNLEEIRERVSRWMEGHRGQKFSAGELTKEFPELEGVAISIFIKPLVESKQVQTDSSDGVRRMKYFVPDNA